MRNIGVVGYGVVGSAVADGLAERGFRVAIYDRYKSSLQDYKPLLQTEAIFICVPTPTKADGTQDLDALQEVLAILKGEKYAGIIVIKSTVLPGTTERLSESFKFPRLCHNPEFLTAANARKDFLNEECVLLSCKDQNTVLELADIYYDAGFKHVRWSKDTKVTELAKYMHNLFLSVKVSFCNDMKEICDQQGVEYSTVKSFALSEGKIGDSHTMAPGPDGHPGFGGACFPKDTKAFLSFALANGIQMETLKGAVDGNLRRRPEYK